MAAGWSISSAAVEGPIYPCLGGLSSVRIVAEPRARALARAVPRSQQGASAGGYRWGAPGGALPRALWQKDFVFPICRDRLSQADTAESHRTLTGP
jgi:hypothetical protein